jgi:hypothetical protein
VVWCASTASMTLGLGGMVQQGADVRRGLMDSHMAGEPSGPVALLLVVLVSGFTSL